MSSPAISPHQARTSIEAFLDHGTFCRESLSIRDKRGISVPLSLTPAQEKLSSLIREQQRRGLPVRIRCLKARQVHMSVGIATHIWKACAFLPGQKGMVWAHVDGSTQELFDYYKQFEEGYRVFRGLKKLPRSGMQDGDAIEYQGGGKITFFTAGGKGGRSGSYKFLHLSETAFPAWSSEIRTGLLGSIPDLPDTMIFDESTANGMGGDFYEAWRAAEDPANKSGWAALFYAWWEHPEYRQVIRPDDMRSFMHSLTDEEHELIQRYSLKPEQIAWRRWKTNTDLEGDKRRFQQEFPANSEEAFLTSGRPRFDMIAVARMPVDPQPIAGELLLDDVGVTKQIRFQPSRDGVGALKVWRRPVKGHRYVIGIDTAQGIDAKRGKGTADPDYSVAQVMEVESGELVASLRVRLNPVPFAKYAWLLCQWFNFAYLVPERNKDGVAVIGQWLEMGVPTALMYQTRRSPHDRRPPVLEEIGWLTQANTKADLIAKLERAILEGSITVYDPITVHELRVFVYTAAGTVEAQEGEHDDCVIALALAVIGLLTLPSQPLVESQGIPRNSGGVQRYGRRGNTNSDGWDD